MSERNLMAIAIDFIVIAKMIKCFVSNFASKYGEIYQSYFEQTFIH
jgi:hypothetical protein